MFYNYKLLFFTILYVLSAVLYYFINQQLILTGIMSGFVLGSAAIFLIISAVCFLLATVIALLLRYCYAAVCKIFKLSRQEILVKTFWYIFTGLSYAAVFIIFIKMTEY